MKITLNQTEIANIIKEYIENEYGRRIGAVHFRSHGDFLNVLSAELDEIVQNQSAVSDTLSAEEEAKALEADLRLRDNLEKALEASSRPQKNLENTNTTFGSLVGTVRTNWRFTP
jgi:hypothetical protein